jgi:sulfur carrier protein ThiS adenylyltransferase
MLQVNEQTCAYTKGVRMEDLVLRFKPGATILLCNGNEVDHAHLPADGDRCTLIREGEMPTVREMEQALANRHGKEHQRILTSSCVGIMGLGGLGSAVAVALAKMGVGKLFVSDYDVVDLSNIHRQHYFLDQIGKKKTLALRKSLIRINPFVAIRTFTCRLSTANIPKLFAGVDVLIECFDDPVMKADAYTAVRKYLPKTSYIGSSGVAGLGSGNAIHCRKVDERVYMVGDFTSDVDECGSLTATRVGIAAHQQANQAIRILLGLHDEK